MGEAKRRKMNDPNFGKIKKQKNAMLLELEGIFNDIEQEYSTRENYLWDSMESECKGIMKRGYDKQSKYQEARLLVYKTLLPFRNTDRDFTEEEISNIKRAGQILFDTEGMSGMHDGLFWSFIPESMTGVIDQLWHGIGEWVS